MKANIAILEEKEDSLKKSLETLEKVDEIDVDEAVTTTAPLYKQYVQIISYLPNLNNKRTSIIILLLLSDC